MKTIDDIKSKLNETIEDIDSFDISTEREVYKAALTDLLEWINEEDE